MVKLLYKVFLGLMVALFVGFGISVFYPAPKVPDYPVELQNISGSGMTKDQEKINTDFNSRQKTYQTDFAKYSRNVSAIVIALSVVMLILSLTILLDIDLISDGLLLGGLFMLIYGLIRAFMSDNNKFQFAVVTIGLVIVLSLGYWKFLRPEAKK